MKAFIFDLNGTMVNDMVYHTKAWLRLFNEDLGASFTWDEVKPNMYGKNPDVLARMFGSDRFTQEEMERLSLVKETRYQEEFKPHLKLVPGLKEFLEKAYKNNIPLAIGSAAIPFNIDYVLDNLNIRHYFNVIVSADDVTLSKPNPETFLQAAYQLAVPAAECIVFEDVPKGTEAAANAGMPAVILTTTHSKEDFEGYTNIIRFAEDFRDDFIQSLTETPGPVNPGRNP